MEISAGMQCDSSKMCNNDIILFFWLQGRYDLHQPLYVCESCQQQWTPNLKDLLRSGY